MDILTIIVTGVITILSSAITYYFTNKSKKQEYEYRLSEIDKNFNNERIKSIADRKLQVAEEAITYLIRCQELYKQIRDLNYKLPEDRYYFNSQLHTKYFTELQDEIEKLKLIQNDFIYKLPLYYKIDLHNLESLPKNLELTENLLKVNSIVFGYLEILKGHAKGEKTWEEVTQETKFYRARLDDIDKLIDSVRQGTESIVNELKQTIR